MSFHFAHAGLALCSLLAGDPTTSAARGVSVHEPAAFAGFTLFTPLASGSTLLVDMEGEVVHRWDTELPPGAMAYLLDDGHLLRTIRVQDNPRFFGGGLGGRILELDWEGNVVWDYVRSDEQRSLHHDLEVMPNGHVLAIQWEYLSREEAIALGRDPRQVGEKGFWPDAILELERDGLHGAKVVWEWHVKDHLIQDFDRSKAGYGSIPDHPGRIDVNFDHRDKPPMTAEERAEQERIEREMRALGYAGGKADEAAKDDDGEGLKPDWMHTNGIDYDAGRDLIVVSSPHLCEVYVIDHSTTTEQARGTSGGRWGHGGDLLYRWGNPRNYGAGTEADQQLSYQHDPQWLPSADGKAPRLMLFNNGQKRAGEPFSSVDELELPFDPERGFARAQGQAFGPSAPAWSYTAAEKSSFFAPFISGCQRLANGNTLICSGPQGHFFEITADERVVWDFLNPHGGEIPVSFGNAAEAQPKVDSHAVFQATRIAPDHPALAGRSLAPFAVK